MTNESDSALLVQVFWLKPRFDVDLAIFFDEKLYFAGFAGQLFNARVALFRFFQKKSSRLLKLISVTPLFGQP